MKADGRAWLNRSGGGTMAGWNGAPYGRYLAPPI